jgi:hypothetical protein
LIRVQVKTLSTPFNLDWREVPAGEGADAGEHDTKAIGV